MKPQITALALHRLYVGGWLQRSCGMKPQITHRHEGADVLLMSRFKGAAA